MPLKVGVVKYVRPSPYEPIVEATIGALKRVFGTSNVIVTHYDLTGLSQAIREGEVDLFLSSSGFYVRMERYGARAAAIPITTMVQRSLCLPPGSPSTNSRT